MGQTAVHLLKADTTTHLVGGSNVVGRVPLLHALAVQVLVRSSGSQRCVAAQRRAALHMVTHTQQAIAAEQLSAGCSTFTASDRLSVAMPAVPSLRTN